MNVPMRVLPRALAESRPAQAAVLVPAVVLVLAVAALTFPDAYPGAVMLKGALLGTGTGLLAVGLVLTYRTTRIINFAYGAIGGFAASIAIGLHEGESVLEWPVVVILGAGAGIAAAAITVTVLRQGIVRRVVMFSRRVASPIPGVRRIEARLQPLGDRILAFAERTSIAFAVVIGLAAAIGFGAFLQVRDEVDWFVAVPIAVVSGVYIGGLTERIVIRRFSNAPRLVLTVATIGLAQLLGGAALFVPRWFDLPAVVPSFDTPLSDIQADLHPIVFDGNDLALLAVVPVVLVALGWFLLRSEAGIAVRGMAENMARARLLGIPVNALSLLLWCVAGGLAALTVALRAPNSGVPLDATLGPTLILPPLAAAVVARMSSLTVAFAAGVGLGVIDQLVLWNYSDRRELAYVFFLAVIVVALLLQRRSTSRAQLAADSWTAVGVTTRLPQALARLPEIRAAKIILGLAVACAVTYIPWQGRVAQVNYATVTLIFALGALSLVVLTGWGGVVSLGQMALMGVGGITAANLIAERNTDLFLTFGAAAVAGGAVALVLGLPALRVVGQYLAVTTLAFAVVMEQFVVKPSLHPELIPGRFERPELWGSVDLNDERWLYVISLALVVVAVLVLHNLRRSRAGRAIAAVRDNERRAAAAGVSAIETRLAGFVFAGMFAGVAGALHAVALRNVGEQTYPAATSTLLFSMAVIGGASSIGGTLAGVVLVRWLGYLYPEYQILLTGVGLLVILMVVPGGLSQAFQQGRDRFAEWCARRRGLSLVEEFQVVDEPERVVAIDASGNGEAAPGYTSLPSVAARGSSRPALLHGSGVESSYGSFQVLFGIDITVAGGEMLALLGTNGSGKSTLLNSISGLLPPRQGTIMFDGHDITKLPAERIARLGLSLMPGGKGVFPTLTVAENLRLAAWMHRNNRAAATAARHDVLELFPVLGERWDQLAGDLSGGEQQQLSLGMAFITRPKLLCIDELSLGLAPAVTHQLLDDVRRIHQAGTTVVVVEQSVDVALQLCEHAVFLEQGQVRFRGPTEGLLERHDVLRAVFLGDTGAPGVTPIESGNGERASRDQTLECHGLVKRFGGLRAVNDVDLLIPAATIVGLIGHNGAGKTTLFDLIGGFLQADEGRVVLGGVDISDRPPHRRALASLGRSFQDAQLFSSLTVRETLAVALETHLNSRDPLAAALRLPASTRSERAAHRRADELIDMLGLGRFRHQSTGSLSTGTRRIVELGCLLAQDPAVVLLDEPTAGVAQRETEQLPPLLRTVQAETGCSIVVIEHNMTLLGELCDQLVALDQGTVIATGPPHDVLSDERVVASYLGTDVMAAH